MLSSFFDYLISAAGTEGYTFLIGLTPYPMLCRPYRTMTYSDRICSPCRAEIYQPLYRYRIFSKTPPSPLNLKRGSTSPPPPSPQERAPTGKPAVWYSQTSFNFVDFRLHSAEHSSELDALLSLARKFAPAGLLVEFNAIES